MLLPTSNSYVSNAADVVLLSCAVKYLASEKFVHASTAITEYGHTNSLAHVRYSTLSFTATARITAQFVVQFIKILLAQNRI